MLRYKFDFRGILNLDVHTRSGSELILKSESDLTLKSGSDLVMKTGSEQNTRICNECNPFIHLVEMFVKSLSLFQLNFSIILKTMKKNEYILYLEYKILSDSR